MAKRTRKFVDRPSQKTTANTSPAVAPFTELGISGVVRYGGTSRVYEEFLRELQGPAGMKLLREQKDNCPITGAFLFAAQHLARRTTFRFDPANDSNRAREIAERMRGALFDDMNQTWPDQLSEILSFLPFGWAAFEMVFKRCLGQEAPPRFDISGRPLPENSPFLPPPQPSAGLGTAAKQLFVPSKFDDGAIGFKKLSLRAQETMFMWEWDDESNPIVLQQMAPPDYLIRRIPLAKCLHFRTETLKNNPEGRSVLRNSVLSYVYRKNVQNIEAVGIERDLAGYPVFQVKDPNQSPGQAVPDLWNTTDAKAVTLLNKIQQIAREIKRDEQEGMVLPWWLDFKLVSAGGSRRQFDTNQIVLRYDQRIAMAMLADFILLGHEAVGSKGLASTKSALFTTAMAGLLSIITATFNRFGIPQLMRLNGWPMELQPILVHGDVEAVDLADLGTFISNMARSGMPLFPDADLEVALLEAARLPTAGAIDPPTEMYGADTGGLAKRKAAFEMAKRLAKSASREARRGLPKGRAQVGATPAPPSDVAALKNLAESLAGVAKSLAAVTTPTIHVTPPSVTLEPQIHVDAPDITVNVPKADAPKVTVNPPAVHVAAPNVRVTPLVNVAAPKVNVAAPKAPIVNVAAPHVTVKADRRRVKKTIERDIHNRIVGVTEEDE